MRKDGAFGGEEQEGGEDDFTEEDIEMSAYIYSDDADPESFAEECVVQSFGRPFIQRTHQPISSTQRWLNLFGKEFIIRIILFSARTLAHCVCTAIECKNKKMTTNKKNIAERSSSSHRIIQRQRAKERDAEGQLQFGRQLNR